MKGFMAHCIIKIKDKYFIWSTVSDGPITGGMTLAQLRTHFWSEAIKAAASDLKARLAWVEKCGTSMSGDNSVEDTICNNRCGPGDTALTADQIYEKYGK